MLHELGLAQHLGDGVDVARARDLRRLIDEVGPQVVVLVRLAVDELHDAHGHHPGRVGAVKLLQEPTKLHGRDLALVRLVRLPGLVIVGAVGVRLNVAVEPLFDVVKVLALLAVALRLSQLRVLLGARPSLGRARGQHAQQRRRCHLPRARRLVRQRLPLANARRVLGDELERHHNAEHTRGLGRVTLAKGRRRDIPRAPVARKARLEDGGHGLDALAHHAFRKPRQLIETHLQHVLRRGVRLCVHGTTLVRRLWSRSVIVVRLVVAERVRFLIIIITRPLIKVPRSLLILAIRLVVKKTLPFGRLRDLKWLLAIRRLFVLKVGPVGALAPRARATKLGHATCSLRNSSPRELRVS